MGKGIKGYKVFNPDWTCRGFQYRVGEVFEEDVIPRHCKRGFHFCLKASDCFNYYRFSSDNKVAEVTALGDVQYAEYSSKCCTNKILIVREIPWQELLTIVNEGKNCTGLCNTGDCNTGSWNTGDFNTGDCNTGSWNCSSFNTGCFNIGEQKIIMFDKPSDWTYKEWIKSDARQLLNQIPKKIVEWVCSSDITDEEKAEHPTHETAGGYLKVWDESECRQLWWDGLEIYQREIVFSLPNFEPDIFERCTGIKVKKAREY